MLAKVLLVDMRHLTDSAGKENRKDVFQDTFLYYKTRDYGA